MMPDKRKTEALFREFLERRATGEDVDPEEYLTRYPELENELKNCFKNIGMEDAEEIDFSGSASASDESSKESLVLGDFRIIRQIGKGGMGVVYEAEQMSLNRRVALKVLPSHLSYSNQAVRQFRREAEAGGRQRHPGIVTVFAVGLHDDVHYIAQELVEGSVTLADKLAEIRAKKEQPPGYFREVAQIVVAVADALQHAHESGVTHRDIKPSNILIPSRGHPKVTDFGLAKIEDALELSRTGDLTGTPYYMSPEQAMSRRMGIDKRTDIYSLGVTLYEMLTLRRPFEGNTSHEILKKIMLNEPTAPRKINACVPRDLTVICLKAMEKDPVRRYQTSGGVADDLRRYLSGDVILAKPAGFGVRLWKRAKRKPALSAAIGVASVALLALATVLPWFLVQHANEIAGIESERSEKEKKNALILEEEKRKLEREQKKTIAALADVRNERDAKDKALTELNKAYLTSEGYRLAKISSEILPSNPGFSLLLAIESAERRPGLLANNALLASLGKIRELKTLIGHESSVGHSRFSPDGLAVVTASSDFTVRIWDTATGMEIARFAGSNPRFSPNGARLVTASVDIESSDRSDNLARIWDAATGRKILELKGHAGAVYTAAFSFDGQMVATASADGTARTWNAFSGEQIGIFPGHEGAVGLATFTPDDRRLITVSVADGATRVFDLSTEQEILKKEGNTCYLEIFGSDEHRVVSISHPIGHSATGRTASIWEVRTGEETASPLVHDGEINSVDVSVDHRSIVTASDDRTVRVWDASTGKLIKTLRGHEAGVDKAVFGPEASKIISVSVDRTARIWDITTGECTILRGHEGSLLDVDVSRDGERIVSSSADGTARIWNARTRYTMDPVVMTFSFSPDGSRAATIGPLEKNVAIWDVGRGQRIAMLRGHQKQVCMVCFSPDGKRIVTASLDGTSRIYEVSSGKELSRFEGHAGVVLTACFSPDGRKIVTASRDETARVWDALFGEEICVLRGHQKVVWSAVFSPDGQRVLTCAGDGSAKLWDSEAGLILETLKHDNIMAACFALEGRRIITGSMDSRSDATSIWNAETGAKIAKLPGGALYVQSLVCEAVHDTKIVTASSSEEDHCAHVWNIITGKKIASLVGHTTTVESARFSPTGGALLTITADGNVWIWDATTCEPRHKLDCHSGDHSIIGSVLGAWGCFTPDGLKVSTLSPVNREIWLWDVKTGSKLYKLGNKERNSAENSASIARSSSQESGSLQTEIITPRGHQGAVRSVDFAPDGTKIVTASEDSTVCIWNVSTGEAITVLKCHAGPVLSARFSPDGNRVITGSTQNILICSVATGKVLIRLEDELNTANARFSPDGKKVVTSGRIYSLWIEKQTLGWSNTRYSGSSQVQIWESATGEKDVVLRGHGSSVCSAEFSPDGKRLITGSCDETARIWDLATAECSHTLEGIPGPVHTTFFSPDGKKVFTAGRTGFKIWNVFSGEVDLDDDPLDDRIISACFSPDSRRILTAADSHHIAYIHAAEPGSVAAIELREHKDIIRCVLFSPDGEKALTASDDHTARLWNLETGKEIMTLEGHAAPVLCACFSPDGDKIATASADGEVMIWPVDVLSAAKRSKPRDLTVKERRRYDVWSRDQSDGQSHSRESSRSDRP